MATPRDQRPRTVPGPGLCLLSVLLVSICSSLVLASAPPTFAAHSSRGQDYRGSLVSLTSDWSVELAGNMPGQLPGNEFVSLRRIGLLCPARPAGEQVVLANGDCLTGHILAVEGERVRLHAFGDSGPEVTLPLSAVSVIYFAAPNTESSPQLFLRRLTREARRRDTVYLRNGDVVDGVVRGMDSSKQLHLRVVRTDRAVALDKVAAIALNTRLTRLRLPRGSYGHLVLADGSRLPLAQATADAVRLQGTTSFGMKVDVSVSDIVALDRYQGPAKYLSELQPQSYEFRSFLGTDHADYVVDGSVLPGAPFGGALALGKNIHDRGIGMAGASRLQYALDGRYRRFEATVGLDASAFGGSGKISVLLDGRPVALGFDGNLKQGTDHFLRVDLAGARTLTLVVDFGAEGNVRERVDWADARLVR